MGTIANDEEKMVVILGSDPGPVCPAAVLNRDPVSF
jgi:hypothetical protein